MKSRKPRPQPVGPQPKASTPKSLEVLIIGGEDAIKKAPGILQVLTLVQPETSFTLLGVALHGLSLDDSGLFQGDIPVFHNYEELIRDTPPDIVMLMVDDNQLMRHLVQQLPPHTRIVDSFSLHAFQTLGQVSTQLGTTEKKVRNLELIKDVLMSGSHVSIMVVDEDFRVLDIDEGVSRRLKISPDGCLGRGCYWLIHGLMEPCHERGGECPVVEVLHTGRSTHRVKVQRQKEGKTRYFTVSGYPLGEGERGKKSVLIVWKDVTQGLTPLFDQQAQKLAADFRRMLHQDKMAALGKLAAAAVHEINNPLQGILTFAKLMRAGLDEGALTPETIERFRTYLELIAEESSRCGHILKALLSFARLDSLQKSTFDLNSVLDELLLLVRNRMELQKVAFRREVPIPFVLYGDRNQIKQVFLNLFLNAIEAMPHGGTLTVSAEMYPHMNKAKVSVTDTGTGIDQSVRESLLEPFVTTKETGKGVGLGLSMVYGIITQHGGSLEIDSEENKGTTFVVSLPLEKSSKA